MKLEDLVPHADQVSTVHLQTGTPPTPEHWPVGYTMTVWGVAVGATVLIALVITTWLRLSPHARSLAVQAVVWRISPMQLLALRTVSRISGTPASVLLVSRGAFESAVLTWAASDELVSVRSRRALASLSGRVYGRLQA